ncbi:MAG: DNA alkylation repair protein [Bacillota bacterium]|nr:DNA alkylation repair protein [Bacillota bacterium]MDW7683729.1 DNA alkylation repair protein [Bacillota bacterium]
MDYQEIMEKLAALAKPSAEADLKRFGNRYKNVFGVAVPALKKLAKTIGKQHELAEKLWQADMRETRILASMIACPEAVTVEQMDRWANDFATWEICDQVCRNLFVNVAHAYRKCFAWSGHEKELVRRAGFVLMSRLAVTDKSAPDTKFMLFMAPIKQGATDERPYVKKAVNRALQQIGKRSFALNELAVHTALEIADLPGQSAAWIASDALRELQSEAVQQSLPAPVRMIIYAAAED